MRIAVGLVKGGTAAVGVVLAAALTLTACAPRQRGAEFSGGGSAPTASAAPTPGTVATSPTPTRPATPGGTQVVDERALADLERTLTDLEQVLAQLDAQLSGDPRH